MCCRLSERGDLHPEKADPKNLITVARIERSEMQDRGSRMSRSLSSGAPKARPGGSIRATGALLAVRPRQMHRVVRRLHDVGRQREGRRDERRDLLAGDLVDLETLAPGVGDEAGI